MTTLSRWTILVALAACAGPDNITPQDPTSPGPTGPRFTITGTVFDSLASRVGPSRAAVGVRVSINGIVGITDAAGRFTLTQVLGGSQVPFELLSQEYEPSTGTIRVASDITVSLPLRRLAPLITAFEPSGDTTRLTVVDLQNRKEVERWQQTQAILANGATLWTQLGNQWSWNPVDAITWLVYLPNTTGAQEFHFEIHDANGASSQAVCRVDGGCDHLFTGEAVPSE